MAPVCRWPDLLSGPGRALGGGPVPDQGSGPAARPARHRVQLLLLRIRPVLLRGRLVRGPVRAKARVHRGHGGLEPVLRAHRCRHDGRRAAGHPRGVRHGRRPIQHRRQQDGRQLVSACQAGDRGRAGQCRHAAGRRAGRAGRRLYRPQLRLARVLRHYRRHRLLLGRRMGAERDGHPGHPSAGLRRRADAGGSRALAGVGARPGNPSRLARSCAARRSWPPPSPSSATPTSCISSCPGSPPI